MAASRFADGDHAAGIIAAHGQHRIQHARRDDALAAQRHHERVDEVGHVLVQDQQGGRHAAAPIRIAHLRDLAAVRRALRHLGEGIPQDGGKVAGIDAGEVVLVQGTDPGADQRTHLFGSVGRLVLIDQREGLRAEVVRHVFVHF
jgi:hypothetical protein